MQSIQANKAGLKCAGCRVLVVENDPAARADHIKNLEKWGYRPAVAEGLGQTLLQNARQKARDNRCHLAVVDMRLLDDSDPNDTSGLDLVPDLKPAISVVVTAYDDAAKARQAFKEKGAEDFISDKEKGRVREVGKEAGPAILQAVLAETTHRYCRYELEYQWPPGYGPQQIIQRLAPDDPEAAVHWQGVPLDEPDCVLRRLYGRQVKAVKLTPLLDPYETPDSVLSGRHSVILAAEPQGIDGSWQQREIVKLAPSDHIDREIKNYDYVRKHLLKGRTARIENPPFVFWDIGAIRYTDEAAEGRDILASWYRRATSIEVAAALHDLFTNTLGPWYRLPTEKTGQKVYEYYTAPANFKRLKSRIESYPDQSERFWLYGVPHRLLNPVRWARVHSEQSGFVSRWDAIVHGDLHCNNVFGDENNKTYVIDYEHSGPGYILRDFVELEKDIRLQLLPLTLDQLPLAYHLDMLLLAPTEAEEFPAWKEPIGVNKQTRVELHKAFDAICALRKEAIEAAELEQIDEYYWALLMETLISVTRDYSKWKDQKAAELARDRATLTAALICERLDHWGQSWPPEEWRRP